MEKDRLLEILKNERNDRDAIRMILSNYADFGGHEGCMVSVKQFRVVAGVLIEWWEGKKQATTDKQLEHDGMLESVYSVAFDGQDDAGKIVKSIKVIADSEQNAVDIVKEVNSSFQIYGAVKV